MLLTGGALTAPRAVDLGLVHRVVPSDDFETACLRAVSELLPSVSTALARSRARLYSYPDDLRVFLAKETAARRQAFGVLGR